MEGEKWGWLDGEKFDYRMWDGRHYFNWDSNPWHTKVNSCGALARGNETFFQDMPCNLTQRFICQRE